MGRAVSHCRVLTPAVTQVGDVVDGADGEVGRELVMKDRPRDKVVRGSGMVVKGDRGLDIYNVTMYMHLARGGLLRQLSSSFN